MPTLSEILKQAKAQASSNIKYAKQTVKQSPSNLGSSLRREARNASRDIVDSTVSKVSQGIVNETNRTIAGLSKSAGQLMRGDVSSALSTLGKTFGYSGGKLSRPSQDGVSGSNGITPGDALEGALARSDPAMSFLWYAEMPIVQDLNGRTMEMPWYFVEEATPTFYTFEVKDIYREGKHKHFPGGISLDSLRLSLYTSTSFEALDYIRTWTGGIVKPTNDSNRETSSGLYGTASGRAGSGGIASGYKKTVSIYLMSPDKSEVAKLEYYGCWPQVTDSYQLDSGSSTRIVTNITLSVDDMAIKMLTRKPGSVIANLIGNQTVGGYSVNSLVNSLTSATGVIANN